MTIPIYRPYVFLRCRKCGTKTDHVLTGIVITGKGEIEENYECQQCGEKKKIYELATSYFHSQMQLSEAKRLKGPQKKTEITEKVEEKQKKDYMEVTINVDPNGNRQPKKIKIRKKKRKLF
ncbi:MAG: hypothetical protein ACE5OV_00485 [Candidatus Bathyarchaeia archaeon]